MVQTEAALARQTELDAKLLIHIHDELVWEVREEHTQAFCGKLHHVMTLDSRRLFVSYFIFHILFEATAWFFFYSDIEMKVTQFPDTVKIYFFYFTHNIFLMFAWVTFASHHEWEWQWWPGWRLFLFLDMHYNLIYSGLIILLTIHPGLEIEPLKHSGVRLNWHYSASSFIYMNFLVLWLVAI